MDNGVEGPTEDQTIGYYNQVDVPFYYDLANKFAISDRQFASVLGPTFPNRSYLMAATSFGHLTTSDTFPPFPPFYPPPPGYKPITGTIFDLLTNRGISWADYFEDAPQGASFLPFPPFSPVPDPHFLPEALFLAQAAGARRSMYLLMSIFSIESVIRSETTSLACFAASFVTCCS